MINKFKNSFFTILAIFFNKNQKNSLYLGFVKAYETPNLPNNIYIYFITVFILEYLDL